VVLPLLRRYFLISRAFEYFVGPVLSRAHRCARKSKNRSTSINREFFTEGSEENKDSYLRLIPNPLSYLRFLLFSFSFCRGRPESDARTLRTPKALRAKSGKPIPLRRPEESSVFVLQSRKFGMDRLITNHSGIRDSGEVVE
jgi:hypothetical protein